jgi:hypothetical protein
LADKSNEHIAWNRERSVGNDWREKREARAAVYKTSREQKLLYFLSILAF